MTSLSPSALLLPVGWLLIGAALSSGFRGQPHLVHARTPSAFKRAVERAGGRPAARTGIVVDLGFIVCFAATVIPVLWQAADWWAAVAGAAVALDLLESWWLWWLLGREPRSADTKGLALLAGAKMLAYLTSVVALFVVLT